MGFYQDINQAYAKWEKRENKAGVTFPNFKNLFEKMETLKNDLCKIAKIFDEKLVNAKDKKGVKISEETYESIYKGFLDRIQDAKDFIDFSDLKGSGEPKWLSEEFKSSFKSFNGDFKSVGAFLIKQSKVFESMVDIFELYSTPSIVVACILLRFFVDVLSSMRSYLGETERVIAEDNDFFELEGKYTAQWAKRHGIDPIPEGVDVKIFPQGKPLPKEVKQAGIEDCYLMSALIALAKKQPKVIKDCFVQGLKDIDKKDRIVIRFYGENKSGGWGPIEIDVDKKNVVMPEEIKDGALWPKLIEKAFIVYENRPGLKKRGKIDWGTQEQIFRIMTGKYSSTKLSEIQKKISMKINENSPEKIIYYIKRALQKKKKLLCFFPSRFHILMMP